MKQNLKPGDIISFPSLEEMRSQHVRTECYKENEDDALWLVNIYKINVVKNGVSTSKELQLSKRYIRK